jgi:hypothetical protein
MDATDDSKSFFKHVFNFDDDSKSEILNIIQYALIALIPVILLNKSMSNYVPEADDKKSSVELSAEIVIQIIVMFIGLMIIHRINTFVPTYSGVKYPDFHIIFNILAVLMITLSLQTKLGEKVSILVERLMDLWNGTDSSKKKSKNGKNGNVKVSQPISGQQQMITGQIMMPQTQPTYTDGTSINSLPTSSTDSSTTTPTQQMPNYDNMYQQQTTPLVGAATPGMEGFSEPMAANSVLGGGAFGSW